MRDFLKRPVSAFLRSKRHFTVVAWNRHSSRGGTDQRKAARCESFRFIAPVRPSETATLHWVFGLILSTKFDLSLANSIKAPLSRADLQVKSVGGRLGIDVRP